MSKLLIQTQVFENYGTESEPHWKPKGGGDYVIKNFKANSRRSIAESATETVMAVRAQIERDNEFFREHIIGWNVVADDYLTEFERSQLEYEGKIRFPANEIVW